MPDEEPLEGVVEEMGDPASCLYSIDRRVRRVIEDCVLSCLYFGGNCRDCVYNCSRSPDSPPGPSDVGECLSHCRQRFEECASYCRDSGLGSACYDFCHSAKASCINACLAGGERPRGVWLL